MSEIIWPERYLPGTTDNYVSNEVIAKGLASADVWTFLSNATLWPTYYSNASRIGFDGDAGPKLSLGVRFRFTTFGLDVEAEVVEFVPPLDEAPARIAWRAWVDGDEEQALDVLHAWLIEDLSGGRVRVLTQESQIGKPAIGLAQAKPNPMLNAHQDWLEGLILTAAQQKAK
jgi:hypothetical protein